MNYLVKTVKIQAEKFGRVSSETDTATDLKEEMLEPNGTRILYHAMMVLLTYLGQSLRTSYIIIREDVPTVFYVTMFIPRHFFPVIHIKYSIGTRSDILL